MKNLNQLLRECLTRLDKKTAAEISSAAREKALNDCYAMLGTDRKSRMASLREVTGI